MAKAAPILDEEQVEEPTIYEPPADLLRMAEEVAAQEDPHNNEQRKRDAMMKLRRIALDYPRSTPNEFVIFGRGQQRFSLGELRDLFDLGA